MSVKTQGSALYIADTLSSSVAAVLKLACPTGITGVGAGAASQINDTCLDDLVDESFMPGLGSPGTITVPFILKPAEASHQALFDMKEAKELFGMMVCLSDGAAAPTLDSNEALVAPNDRTSFAFQAYVADVAIDIATNEVVRGTLTLQRSGAVTPTWKSA
jgi:hypothetical protein